MAGEKVSQGENTEEQEAQTVTIEQFEEMNKKYEDLIKIQSGSDKAVTELQKLLKQKEVEIENEKKTAEQKLTDKMNEINERLDKSEKEKAYAVNKSLATQMLIDADLKVPRTLDRLIGANEDETVKFIKAYIEDRADDHASEKDKEAKKYGRKIVDTTQKSIEKMSYEDMVKLSDEKFNAIPQDLVNKAMNAALGATK